MEKFVFFMPLIVKLYGRRLYIFIFLLKLCKVELHILVKWIVKEIIIRYILFIDFFKFLVAANILFLCICIVFWHLKWLWNILCVGKLFTAYFSFCHRRCALWKWIYFVLVLVAMKTRLDFVGDCGFHCHQMVLEPMFLSVQPSLSKGGNFH